MELMTSYGETEITHGRTGRRFYKLVRPGKVGTGVVSRRGQKSRPQLWKRQGRGRVGRGVGNGKDASESATGADDESVACVDVARAATCSRIRPEHGTNMLAQK